MFLPGDELLSGQVETLRQPDGGFSFQPITEDVPTTGYMVSLPEDEGYSAVLHFNELTVPRLRRFYELVEKLVKSDTSVYVGGWHDAITGLVYLDVSRRYDDLAKAIQAGHEANQISIYDLNHNETLYLEPAEVAA